MGGKNVAIVLRDADLDLAANLTAAGAMRYAGQKCTATSRVVVAREVEADFLDRLRTRIAALPLGPVTDPASAIGPVISASSRDSIRRVLDESTPSACTSATCRRRANSHRVTSSRRRFCETRPTDSDLARRELFGPVLATFAADDLEHAVTLANDTVYGLSAALFTRDVRSALRYIDQIEVGMVRVNGDTTGVDPHAPFGGMKGSSSGSREQGPAAREFYTEIKTVQLNA